MKFPILASRVLQPKPRAPLIRAVHARAGRADAHDDVSIDGFLRTLLVPLLGIALLVYLTSETMTRDATKKVTIAELSGRVRSEPAALRSILVMPGSDQIRADFANGDRLVAEYTAPTPSAELEPISALAGVRAFNWDETREWSVASLLPLALLFGLWLPG
jgi:hypothetical protein